MGAVESLIHLVIQALVWLVIVDALLTWIPAVDRSHPLVKLLKSITDPILSPFRRLVPPERTGYIDLSPLLAVIALNILDRIIYSLF